MRIPLRPPSSPLQDAILYQLQRGKQTKQTLSETLNRPTSQLARSLRALVAQGKIRQEKLDEKTYYFLSTASEEQAS